MSNSESSTQQEVQPSRLSKLWFNLGARVARGLENNYANLAVGVGGLVLGSYLAAESGLPDAITTGVTVQDPLQLPLQPQLEQPSVGYSELVGR